MKFKLVINKEAEEEVTAVVHERTEMTDAIEHIVMNDGQLDELYGYSADVIKILKINEIESKLPECFIRINKSAIANRRKIVQFDVQFSGAVDAVFKSGYKDYVSRRCFAELKRRYGI